jgi:putative salt-induced outer membrane protein
LYAAEAVNTAAETKGQWTGEAELGFISTSGNTETDTINAKAKIRSEYDKWRHSGEISAYNNSDETGTTAEKYELKIQSDYKFREFEYVFALFTYEDDRFSGYNFRINESVGYGRRVLHENNMTLDLEIGPGARQSELDNGNSENELTLRGAAKYNWSISKTSRLSEDLSIDAGEDVTVSKSVTALSSKINGSLAMKIAYTVKRTSSVPPGFKKNDTETVVTLVYSY